jgi:Leucine-rich repeat (LRR) protein
MSCFKTILLLAIAASLISGCKPTAAPTGSSTPGTDSSETVTVPKVAPEPDDAGSVSALEEAGAKLKKDGDGLVIEVDFRGTTVGDAALENLAGLRRVRSVLLNETAVTDAGMATVGKVTTLQNVDLRGCTISNAGLEPLTVLSELKALRLSGESGVTSVDDDGMVHVAKMKNLKALLLDFLWISEVGLEQLAGLDKLEELYLAKTLVGDDALAMMSQFPRLKKLRLSQCQFENEGLAHLTKVTTLEDLDLSENNSINDSGMPHLAGLKKLKRLNLWRTFVGDPGVEKLAGLTAMEWLNLDNSQISDDSLKHLSGMSKLSFLHLGSTLVSDAGLPALNGLSSLKALKVTRTAVTEEGVAELKKSLPDTEIQLRYITGQ